MKKQIFRTTNPELNEILEEQLPRANMLLAKIMLAMATLYLILWVTYLAGFYHMNTQIANLVLIGSIAVYCLVFCNPKMQKVADHLCRKLQLQNAENCRGNMTARQAAMSPLQTIFG